MTAAPQSEHSERSGHSKHSEKPEQPEHSVTNVLDNRSAPCAIGLIRAADRIHAMAAGQVLEVLSRDRFAPMEVPVWAQRDGHELLLNERTGSWPRRYWRFQIRRGA